MCDWSESDYAEYLRWVEAAEASSRVLAEKSRPEKNRWEAVGVLPAKDAIEA